MDDTDTGSPDPYMPEEAWSIYYLSLRRSLEIQAKETWHVSDYLAELFAEKALDQPFIRDMIAGLLPKQPLKRQLLNARLAQVYVRYCRTHLKEESLMDVDTKSAKDSTADTAFDNLFKRDLKAAVLQLPEEERRIFLLRYLLNRSFVEIGRTCGTSDETARRKYQKAVQLLSNYLNHGA